MSRGIYVALSGAVAQEQALETTATNLANASTAGYQRSRAVFREALVRAGGGGRTEKLHYAVMGQTAIDGTRGAIHSTGRELDVALAEGDYLAVSTPRGERYTRAGSLRVGSGGTLCTAGGGAVVGEDGKPITIDGTKGEPTIAADGSIMQGASAVGRLKVVRGADGTTFSHEGAGILVARGVVQTVGQPALELRAVEESNASAVASMTELVTASRTFEAFQRMLETFGECDRKVLTTTSGPTE
jgi:flagellar basal body rod protein FlgG